MSVLMFTKMQTLTWFLPAECNKFVILEMDSYNDISTKLLGSSFSQEENPAFCKTFCYGTATDFIPCCIYPN